MSVATLESMSTDEVANWIMTLKGGSRMKEIAVAAIRANEITGEDLAEIKSKDDLRDFDIPRIFLSKLWRAIEAKRAEKGATIEDKFAELIARHEQARKRASTAFRIEIVIGTKHIQTRAMFEPSDTVFKLKQAIVDQEGCGNTDELRLICRGKPLIDNKTLEESGINALTVVLVTFRVRGGGVFPGIYTVHINESDGQWTASGETKVDDNEFKGTVRYDNHAENCPFNGKIDEQQKFTFKVKYGGSWYDYKCDFKHVDGSVGFVGLWKGSGADSFPSSQTVILKLVKKE